MRPEDGYFGYTEGALAVKMGHDGTVGVQWEETGIRIGEAVKETRSGRLLAIFMHLLEHETITVSEITARFAVGKKEARGDMDCLSCHVPLEEEPAVRVGRGYQTVYFLNRDWREALVRRINGHRGRL